MLKHFPELIVMLIILLLYSFGAFAEDTYKVPKEVEVALIKTLNSFDKMTNYLVQRHRYLSHHSNMSEAEMAELEAINTILLGSEEDMEEYLKKYQKPKGK